VKTLMYLPCFLLLLAGAPAAPWAQGAPDDSNPLFAPSDDDMELEELPSEADKSTEEADKMLRLRRMVQSATKGETTVQEAPAVITIFTEDDINDYGFRSVFGAFQFVPSVLTANAQYDNVPIITSNGLSQGILLVQDGISLFDSIQNGMANMRRWPLELVKRIEFMSSPGGVLWGANSYLGIASIITKEAEDINGVQMGVGGGTGPGDQDVFRTYGIFGKVYGDLSVLLHLSGEFYRGPKYEMLPIRLYAASPQPNSPIQYGRAEELSSFVPMNYYGTFNGKIKYKKWSAQWSLPYLYFPGMSGHTNNPLTLYSWPMTSLAKLDNLKNNAWDSVDRFMAVRFKDRLLDDSVGMDVKVYATQIDRAARYQILPQVEGTFNGMAFQVDTKSYRAGTSFDFDWALGKRTRVLFGAESFYEYMDNADFLLLAPHDDQGVVEFGKTPQVCPYHDVNGDGIPVYDPTDPTGTSYAANCKQPFMFKTDRLIMGTFASLQHRFENRVILDGGLRFQVGPSGSQTQDPVLLPALSVVVPLAKDWFWKVNYLSGFRQPVFFNTSGNSKTIVYAPDPNLRVERSEAIQTEVNALLVKNQGRIQELSFRLNYSYITLTDTIRINQSQYYNSGERWVHAVEGLARLYLQGGHNFYLGYSFNTMWGATSIDGGMNRSVPNQWLNFASVIKLAKNFDFITTLQVIGAYEDPNRVMDTQTTSSKASWLAFEKVPAAGLVNLGFRWITEVAKHRAEFSLMTYNILDTQSYYTADYYQDLAATTETVPTKGQRFYFFANSKFYF